MRDLVKVKVLEATKDVSKATCQPMLIVKVELEKPILLEGEEVNCLYTVVPDEDSGSPRAWRQAQFRYVVGLDPFYLASKELSIPSFTKVEVRSIVGKEFLAAIDVESAITHGEKLHIMGFYRVV